MKLLCYSIICFTIFACQKRGYDNVWQTYDSSPPLQAGSNPYEIRPQYYNSPYPIYDNDSTYEAPRNTGLCGYLGDCE